MTKFPHITELGLEFKHWSHFAGQSEFVVLASDLNHLLSQGVRVELDMIGDAPYMYEKQPGDNEPHTHSALLIGVRPIQKPDSLEQLARDLAATDKFENGSWTMNTEYWVEWARRLVEKECQHKRSSISEPHLAGARTCSDCGAYKSSASGEWK